MFKSFESLYIVYNYYSETFLVWKQFLIIMKIIRLNKHLIHFIWNVIICFYRINQSISVITILYWNQILFLIIRNEQLSQLTPVCGNRRVHRHTFALAYKFLANYHLKKNKYILLWFFNDFCCCCFSFHLNRSL